MAQPCRCFALAALACALVTALAFAGCGGEVVVETASPVATATRTTTRAATGTAQATATGEAERQPRLIFLRPQPGASSGDRLGVIYLSRDLAGSDVIQLTPADVRASFVGLSESDGATILYYLAAGGTSDVFTLEARDLATGKSTTLPSIQLAAAASINPSLAVPPSGSLSPDGRYVALSHRDGLELLDLTANGRQNVFARTGEACENGTGGCSFYLGSAWSPDGRLLLVWTTTGFEAADLGIVDPFQQPAQRTSAPFGVGVWSPAGDALCGWGLWDTTSGLCLSEAPQWQARSLVPEDETGCVGVDPERAAGPCVWLDEQRIAFVTGMKISIYDLETAAVTDVADLGGASPVSPGLFAIPGTSTLVFNDRESGQPELLNTTDGTRTSILHPGDWLVAVTQPIALPEEVVAAEPKVQPCVPLTAGCELQVTNVAPEQLNVRKGPGQETEVMGSLSEGETVCVTGSSHFTGPGFWWWPVRTQGGIEGWMAEGDPQEPGRPWLTPTGRKCEI